ncbi:MAG: Rrf2 family transcriptional regulator, partial [Oscillospiraceae bacterium]|nr:Rrf2 family transcriptional regulator [Oscillospiraceae bacterium]
MKISTKGRYALRMLLDLAEHQELGYISLKEIAERQHISKKYLEQI